ncbi:MAG: hypothetical protein HOI23_23485 [Deltaproteobacteria bacterium]|jgi:ABC-type transporter MlaC component|nr:hypothetical protein [Deltaproteobacteria bacterium]MBT6491131.1 hypothetical protein [Deltaproteobacteria bacterium]
MTKFLPILTLAFVTFAASVAPASKQSPLDKSRILVDVLQQVVQAADTKKLSATELASNKKIYAQLDQLIDFKKLTEGPVKPHKKSLSKKQVKTIKTLFKDAIRNIAYPKSGSFFKGAELTWGTPVQTGTQTDVPLDIFVEEEDLEVSLIFHWVQGGKTFKLFDLSIDDASLVKDYQNQFGKIIKEEGAATLVSKLKKRLDEAQKKHGPLT